MTWARAMAACVAMLAGALLTAACAPRAPAADATLASSPTRWVALAPAEVAATPEFRRLVEVRRTQFEVQVVEYASTDSAQASLARLRAVLDAASPTPSTTTTTAPGFVLIVGGPDRVSMGPWFFEGLDTPVLTDLPLASGLPVPAQVSDSPAPTAFAATTWRPALERQPAWLVGRLPFDDAALTRRVLDATVRQMAGSTASAGSALLGAQGMVESWNLSSARRALRERGWRASLEGPRGPADRATDDGVLAEWSRESPQLVELADEARGAAAAPPLGTLLRPAPGASKPQHPALVIALTSAGVAWPGAPLSALLSDEYAAGGAVFTGPSAPFPLGPAAGLARSLPIALAQGSSLAQSVESARRRYWIESASDLGMAVPGTPRWRLLNTLSLTTLGDPALRIAGSSAPTPPLVIPPSSTETARTTAETAPSASPAEPASGSWLTPKWISLGALLAFLGAMLLWLLSRRSN